MEGVRYYLELDIYAKEDDFFSCALDWMVRALQDLAMLKEGATVIGGGVYFRMHVPCNARYWKQCMDSKTRGDA